MFDGIVTFRICIPNFFDNFFEWLRNLSIFFLLQQKLFLHEE